MLTCLKKILKLIFQHSFLKPFDINLICNSHIYRNITKLNIYLSCEKKANMNEMNLNVRKKNGWIGHILRKASYEVSYRALVDDQQGSRIRGRPRTIWRRLRILEVNNQNDFRF